MILDAKVRSKINNIFRNHNPLEKYSVKIYKIDPYFYEQYEKHIQVDDNKHKYTLFKIDIYFSEYSLAVEIDKKGVDRDLIFEEKRQKVLEEKINCKFIRINKSCDLDYELGDVHTLIDEFQNNKIKELEDKNKKLMIISEENKISKPLNY